MFSFYAETVVNFMRGTELQTASFTNGSCDWQPKVCKMLVTTRIEHSLPSVLGKNQVLSVYYQKKFNCQQVYTLFQALC